MKAPRSLALLALLALCALRDAAASEGAMSAAQWRHSEAQITALRQRELQLAVRDGDGEAIAGAVLSISPERVDFCLGSAFNEWVVPGNQDFAAEDPARFEQWFDRHFNCGTPSSTLQWGLMQAGPGQDGIGVPYADRAIEFLARGARTVLGHGIGWENPDVMPDWVAAAQGDALLELWRERIEHLMGRYRGVIRHWVGINEMLDYRALEDKFDRDGFSMRAWVYQQMRAFDPGAQLLVNEAGILAQPGRVEAYIELVKSLRAVGAPIDIIGVQAHFWQRDQRLIDFDVVRERLDRLASLGLPIWITEFDFGHPDDTVRADQFEGFLRTALAHPAVEAVIQWGFWEGAHWRANWGYPVALVDRDWRENPVGRRYAQMLQRWRGPLSEVLPSGQWGGHLLHGRYRVSARSGGRVTERQVELVPGEAPFTLSLTID